MATPQSRAARPRPRDRQPKQQQAPKAKKLRLTFDGKVYDISPSQLGPGDDLVTRQQVGFPLMPFLREDVFGADSILILLWTGRRKNGEPNLTFNDVLAEYPTYEALENIDFEIESIDEDPEA